MNMDKKLSILVISALILTAATAVLGVGLMYVIQHPEAFVQEQIASEEVEEVPVDEDRVEDGIDVATGFIAEGDYMLVKTTCTACHSSKLVLQNRASREGWLDMIRWMQETQKLWDLEPNEDKILDYLATYYAPKEEGRRKPLTIEEWYVIQ